MITVFGWSVRAPSQLTRLVMLSALSATLMALDHRGQQLETIRGALTTASKPILFIAAVPIHALSAIGEFFATRTALREEIARYDTDHARLNAQLQQFEALEAENRRLREMLGSAPRVADRALAAELIEVSAEPYSRTIIVARGTNDGAYLTQPVIDAYGIVGQVTQVTAAASRITLITDPSHAIPALVGRNGLRVLVFGTGDADRLKVPYLSATADIKEGDVLASSGLGGIFPPGYPVARIEKIHNDPNEPFLDITARPAARLNHSTQVLLIWPGVKAVKTKTDAKAPAPKTGGTP